MSYAEFLASYDRFLRAKANLAAQDGVDVDPTEINPLLKPHQAQIVEWAVRGGRRGIFAAFGIGKGTLERPGRRVRQKTGLNRSISDAGWAQFVGLLAEKLQARGGTLIRVDPYGTSQGCSGCGIRVAKALSERWHQCPACGLGLHRDHNAAVNIHHRAWAVPVAEAA